MASALGTPGPMEGMDASKTTDVTFYDVQILPFAHCFPVAKSCFVSLSRKAGSIQEVGRLGLPTLD